MEVIDKIIAAAIGMVIAFQLLASFATPLCAAADDIAAKTTTYGNLVSLFENGGVLLMLLVIGVFYLLYKLVWQ